MSEEINKKIEEAKEEILESMGKSHQILKENILAGVEEKLKQNQEVVKAELSSGLHHIKNEGAELIKESKEQSRVQSIQYRDLLEQVEKVLNKLPKD